LYALGYFGFVSAICFATFVVELMQTPYKSSFLKL